MTKVIKILKILNFKPWTLPANSLVPPKARKLSAGKVFHILGDSGASQSGREKRRDESFQARAEEPLGQANAGSWLGTKNALYYWAQSANSISWVLFMSLYPTAKLSHQTCPVRSPRLYGVVRSREIFIFYFPNQKRRNYRWGRKTFPMLSARTFQFPQK